MKFPRVAHGRDDVQTAALRPQRDGTTKAHPVRGSKGDQVKASPAKTIDLASLWSALEPILKAERARQAKAIGRHRSAVSALTAPKKLPEKRICKTRKAAEWFEVSVKVFLRDYAPHLTPLPPSVRNPKRQHRRWDSYEFHHVVDRMTGGRSGRESIPEDIAYVRAQMEKRLS